MIFIFVCLVMLSICITCLECVRSYKQTAQNTIREFWVLEFSVHKLNKLNLECACCSSKNFNLKMHIHRPTFLIHRPTFHLSVKCVLQCHISIRLRDQQWCWIVRLGEKKRKYREIPWRKGQILRGTSEDWKSKSLANTRACFSTQVSQFTYRTKKKTWTKYSPQGALLVLWRPKIYKINNSITP